MKEIAVPKKWITIAGGVGFALLILTFGIYAVTSVFAWYVKIPMAIGGVGVLVFWILSVIVSRSARYGSNAFVMVLLAFLILIMVNFVSARRFATLNCAIWMDV